LDEKIDEKNLKVDIVAYDYIGYGICKGKSSEAKCYRSINAVYQDLLKNGVKSQNIVLYGRSLGSGPTVHMAKLLATGKKKIAGVILQSPLSSAVRVVSPTLAVLPIDIFENIKKIDKFRYPLYIVHGTQDEVVPYWHGEDLEKKAKNLWKFKSLEGAGHNNIESDFSEEHIKILQEYFEYLASQPYQENDEDQNYTVFDAIIKEEEELESHRSKSCSDYDRSVKEAEIIAIRSSGERSHSFSYFERERAFIKYPNEKKDLLQVTDSMEILKVTNTKMEVLEVQETKVEILEITGSLELLQVTNNLNTK